MHLVKTHECSNGPLVKIGSRQHHLLYYFAQMWRWETRTAASPGRIANIHRVLHHLKALKVFLHLLRLWQKLWWCMSCRAWHCTLSNCFGYKIHRYIEYVTAKRMVSLTFIDPSCPRCPSWNSLNSNAIKGICCCCCFFFSPLLHQGLPTA